MMKAIGAAALLTTALVSPAIAGDGTWTGTYIGAVGTAGLMSSDNSDHWCDVACNGPSQAGGGGGIGGTVGSNWQDGSFVWGLEGDVSWVDFKNSLISPCSSECASIQSAQWDWYATLRARLGLAVDNTLVYATGGLALVGVKYRSNYYLLSDGDWDGGFAPVDTTEAGIALGAGVEHAFNDNMTLKAEFLYIGLPSHDGGTYYSGIPPIGPSTGGDNVIYRSSAEVIRIGLNWALN